MSDHKPGATIDASTAFTASSSEINNTNIVSLMENFCNNIYMETVTFLLYTLIL